VITILYISSGVRQPGTNPGQVNLVDGRSRTQSKAHTATFGRNILFFIIPNSTGKLVAARGLTCHDRYLPAICRNLYMRMVIQIAESHDYESLTH